MKVIFWISLIFLVKVNVAQAQGTNRPLQGTSDTGKGSTQPANLKKFFSIRPFQVSFIPGFGTNGMSSSKTTANFSLNIIGGHTGGANGLEIGGVFNIDGGNVKYVQVAGVTNIVKGKMEGVQIGGVYNHVADSVRGLQVAGVVNFTQKKMNGIQVAGVANISSKRVNGVQVAGVINYTRHLKGVQIGLINIADSSSGLSIGLINIVVKGYHKLTISANEIQNVNLAFKSGNRKLYGILMAGLNAGDNNKIYSYGYGLGTEIAINKKKSLTVNPELSSQYLYLGSWHYTNILNRGTVNFNVRLGKYVSFFAGPSFSVYVSNQKAGISGYRFPVPASGYNTIKFGNRVTGWFGWNAGISIF